MRLLSRLIIELLPLTLIREIKLFPYKICYPMLFIRNEVVRRPPPDLFWRRGVWQRRAREN